VPETPLTPLQAAVQRSRDQQEAARAVAAEIAAKVDAERRDATTGQSTGGQ
jgi:hypothetical protein